jgi:hypothetical protein
MNSWDACCHSDHKLVSLGWLFEKVKIKTHRIEVSISFLRVRKLISLVMGRTQTEGRLKIGRRKLCNRKFPKFYFSPKFQNVESKRMMREERREKNTVLEEKSERGHLEDPRVNPRSIFKWF